MKIKILSFFALLSLVLSQTQIAGASPLLQTSDYELTIHSYNGESSGSPYQTNTGSVIVTQPNPYTVVMDTTFHAQDNVDFLGMAAAAYVRVGLESVESYPVDIFFYTSDGQPVKITRRDTNEVLANSAAGFVTVPEAMTAPFDQLEFGRYYTTGEAEIAEVGESYTLYIFTFPYDPCENDYATLEPDTFEIDPIIETPLGPEGTPADDQIYATTTGSTYKITTDGGPWNDGTDDRGKETAVSWDGETWTPFDELIPLCVSLDGQTIYIEAESDTFQIRVDDTAGNFADNTNNPDPVTYTIAEAFPLSGTCESQFTYDEGSDLVASVTLPGNDDDVLAATGLTVDEWYAITVTSGTWQDDGAPPDRTDMELKVDGDGAYNEDPAYHDLTTGETGVGCQSTDMTTWFIQAQNINLSLRVNNESGDFTTNTGSLSVSIYHAAYERNLEECEYQFTLDGTPFHDTVNADQEGGRVFAYSDGLGSSSSSNVLGSASAGVAGLDPLVPGAWYVLDTTDGPWAPTTGFLGVSHPANRFYEMAVNDGSGWQPLADWTYPDCNVEIDALGHRRIYFQMPASATMWRLRVNDDATWSSNSGFMGWDLYRAINDFDLPGDQDNPWSSCTDNIPFSTLNTGSWIPVKDDEGIYFGFGGYSLGGALAEPPNGLTTGANQFPSFTGSSTNLVTGDTYVVQIAQGPWNDGEGDANHYDAAISSDNGATWYAMEDVNPAVSCREVDQAGRYWKVMFTVFAGQRWKIRVNDTTGEFADNGGNLAYLLYRKIPAAELGTAGSGVVGEFSCGHPLLMPQALLADDFPETSDVAEWLAAIANYFRYVGYILTDYVPSWLVYMYQSMQAFFAWCPQNSSNIYSLMMQFTQKEPLATIVELDDVLASIYANMEAYDWDAEVVDTSIFTASGRSEIDTMIRERFFPSDHEAIDPWNGDAIVNLNNSDGLPSYFYTCSTVFTDYLPDRMRDSVCFVNSYARETGLSFIMQMVFDIGGLIAIFASFKITAQEIIYMMTGVKPWTKSGAITVIQRVAEKYVGGGGGGDAPAPRVDENAQSLSNQFGGSYQRDSNGDYRRTDL